MPNPPWGPRAGRYLSRLGPRSRPAFIIALLVFSQVYNRVISRNGALAYSFPFPVLGLAMATPTVVVVRPDRTPTFQFIFIFLVRPITSNILTLIQSTARSDIDDSILAR